jgi:hypothetical protein
MTDITRHRASVPDLDGLNEFAPSTTRERVTKEVNDIPDFIKPGFAVGTRSSAQGPKVNVFKVENEDEEVLVKFLEPHAFAPIFQHWVMQDGKRRAYTCITSKNECPMCARGDKAKSSDWFNVIDMRDKEPELKCWYASPDPAAAIKARSANKRTSPLNKEGQYFVVSKTKSSKGNGILEYSLDPVREDELDVWGCNPLTQEQITAFEKEAYDATLVRVNTKQELTAIAEQYLDND